jgi:Ser/Thr protein kinase RdoA (MazF antagonist)
MPSDPRTVLARYPAAYRPSSELEPLGNAGGLSGSRLWRFRAGIRTLVAREWPVDGPPRPILDRTHLWLAEANRLGYVPAPLPSLDGRTLVEQEGRLWEVSPWMDGDADLGRPPGRGNVEAGFAGLAAFHQVLTRSGTEEASPGLVARLREVEAWMTEGFSRLDRLLDAVAHDPVRSLTRRWLEQACGIAPKIRRQLIETTHTVVSLQPCLRDARPEHFLFREGRLTGLVDFGAMGIDSVAADLARLMAEWLEDLPDERKAGMEAYSAIRPLAANELRLIPAFEASSALLGGGRWASWRFFEGRSFDDAEAVTRGLEKSLHRLVRLTGRLS